MNQTCKIALTLLLGFGTVSSYAADTELENLESFLHITNKCNKSISIEGYFLINRNVNTNNFPTLTKKTLSISPNSGKVIETIFGNYITIVAGDTYQYKAERAAHKYITTIDKDGKCVISS